MTFSWQGRVKCVLCLRCSKRLDASCKNSQLQKEAHMIDLNKMPQDVDVSALCTYISISHFNSNPKMYID